MNHHTLKFTNKIVKNVEITSSKLLLSYYKINVLIFIKMKYTKK